MIIITAETRLHRKFCSIGVGSSLTWDLRVGSWGLAWDLVVGYCFCSSGGATRW